MAELILQELNQRRKAIRTHKLDKLPVTVGRGYDNDVILADGYVCSQHACIEQAEAGWLIRNLASVNGVFIQNRMQDVADSAPLHSGDIFVLGKTLLRVVSPHHPVAQSKKMQIPPDRRAQWRTPLSAWGLVLVCVLLLFFDIFVDMGDSGLADDLFDATLMVLILLVLVSIWSAAWAFIGHVLKRETQFHFHLLLVTASIIVLDLIMYINHFIGYNVCQPAIRAYVGILLPILIFGVLCALSIQAATRAPKSRIYLICVLVTGLFMSVALFYQFNSRNKFNPSPEFDAMLFAPWAQIAKGQSLEQFVRTNERLFQELEQ